MSVPRPHLLHKFSHIIWDVDGTITEGDTLHSGVLRNIAELAENGVFHSFVTGRDAAWLIEHLIADLAQLNRDVLMRMNFFAEIGSVNIEIGADGSYKTSINPLLAEHPLVQNRGGIRDRLRALVYDPALLHVGGYDKNNDIVIYDANGIAYLIARVTTPPPFPDYIWSSYKEAMATFENIRLSYGEAAYIADHSSCVETIEQIIKDDGLENSIAVEPVATAINIVPAVNGIRYGKAWGAGQAIGALARAQKISSRALVNKTIAFGDSISDLDLGTPLLDGGMRVGRLPVVFVGNPSTLLGFYEEQLSRIAILNTMTTMSGPRTTERALRYLRRRGYLP